MAKSARRPVVLHAVVCLFAGANSLHAQSPAERAMLAAWDDSLQKASSAAEVSRLETAARQVPGPIGDFRQILSRVRLAEIQNNRGELRDGFDLLDNAVHSHAQWVWPDYALARAYIWLHLHDAPPLPLNDRGEGESNVEAAWRYLASVVATDPEFEPARTLATRLLVAAGDRELRPEHAKVIASLMRRANPDADILLVVGRDLRVRGNYDSAVTVFNRAIAAGGDRSRLALERARALEGLGDSAGAGRSYWSGLAYLTATGREAYRHDLAWILTPDSLKSFDKLPADSVTSWLHRFWDERDAAAAHDPGQRLTEQFRRWNYVFAHYRVLQAWRHNQYLRVEFSFEGLDTCVRSDSSLYWLLAREQPIHEGDIRSKEPLLDHRGLIYLKHGAPWRTLDGPNSPRPAGVNFSSRFVAAPSNPIGPPALGRGVPLNSPPVPPRFGPDEAPRPVPDCNPRIVQVIGPNDAWLYWIDGQLRLLNFRGSCALGTSAPTTLTGYLPAPRGDVGDWAIRGPFLPEYAAAAHEMAWITRIGPTCRDAVVRAIAKGREDSHTAATTDSDSPMLLDAWKTVVQFFGLGSDKERTGEALVSFAFSGKVSGVRTLEGRYEYPLSFRLVAYNRATGEMITVDTLRRFQLQDSLKNGQSLTGWFELPLTAGDWQIALKAGQGVDTIGGYALEKSVHIEGKSGLALSDIVLGIAKAGMWTATDSAPYPLNALGAYSVGGTAEMYYEVRGVPAGQTYRATVEVRSTDPTSKAAIQITTPSERSTANINYVRRSLALDRLAPGSYRLVVTVEAGGTKLVRERPLLVAKP